MRRLFATGAILALLAACNSQGEDAATTDDAASEETAAPAPAAESTAAAAPAPAAAANVNLAVGDWVEVTTQAECHEVGPNADDTPWDVYPGVSKQVIAVEGDQLRVAIGDTECLLPASAVKASDS